MKLAAPRILVIDPEYLVAMEAELLLNGALGCMVEIAMPWDYPDALEGRRFDGIVIDISLVQGEQSELVRQWRAAGTGVVFSTFSHRMISAPPGVPKMPVVKKPFVEEQLLSAVRAALDYARAAGGCRDGLERP